MFEEYDISYINEKRKVVDSNLENIFGKCRS